MSIGEAIVQKVAGERADDRLQAIKADIRKNHLSSKVLFKAIELQSYEDVEKVVNETDKELMLALGAPAAFPNLKISDIVIVNSTNVNQLMFATYAVHNSAMPSRKEGTILNVTSATVLDSPSFPVKLYITQTKLLSNDLRTLRLTSSAGRSLSPCAAS
ncbi:uncharacterized protein BDW70DRAFT_159967 [Aspergillus foveolatus]|uniref:uncharacterized protein n=1 Tax=Aspergillus foveolatus TaxID=210207 RepID=UPI003CCD9900